MVPITILFICILLASGVTMLMPALSAARHAATPPRKLPEIIGTFAPMRLTPGLRIKGSEINTQRLTDLTVSPAGLIVINDDGKQLVALTATGTRSHPVGRAGREPGEYTPLQDALSLEWLGETLVVRDVALRRVTLFDGATGHYLNSFPSRLWTPAARLSSLLPGGSKGFAQAAIHSGHTTRLRSLDGQAIGAFTMPAHDESVPGVIRNDKLYLVVRDTDHAPGIQVYQLG